jgi:hypothetical protein
MFPDVGGVGSVATGAAHKYLAAELHQVQLHGLEILGTQLVRDLKKGIPWLERKGPPSTERPAKLMPQDWLEAQLLRREAEEVLKIKRSP